MFSFSTPFSCSLPISYSLQFGSIDMLGAYHTIELMTNRSLLVAFVHLFLYYEFSEKVLMGSNFFSYRSSNSFGTVLLLLAGVY